MQKPRVYQAVTTACFDTWKPSNILPGLGERAASKDNGVYDLPEPGNTPKRPETLVVVVHRDRVVVAWPHAGMVGPGPGVATGPAAVSPDEAT